QPHAQQIQTKCRKRAQRGQITKGSRAAKNQDCERDRGNERRKPPSKIPRARDLIKRGRNPRDRGRFTIDMVRRMAAPARSHSFVRRRLIETALLTDHLEGDKGLFRLVVIVESPRQVRDRKKTER